MASRLLKLAKMAKLASSPMSLSIMLLAVLMTLPLVYGAPAYRIAGMWLCSCLLLLPLIYLFGRETLASEPAPGEGDTTSSGAEAEQCSSTRPEPAEPAAAPLVPHVGTGDTALIGAARRGLVDEVGMLVGTAEVDVNQTNTDGGGATPLIVAAQEGQTAVVHVLLAASAAVDQAATNGTTPLFAACQRGHAAIALVLTDAGAKVNQRKANGFTPLLVACQEGHVSVIKVLLSAGAQPNQAKDNGVTPLYMACQHGNAAAASALIDAGAVVDQPRANGSTPLLASCHNGHLTCVEILCAHGASRKASVGDDQVVYHAEHVATKAGHVAISAWLSKTADNEKKSV